MTIEQIKCKTVHIKGVSFNQNQPFSLIAGPCVLQSKDHALMIAESLTEITARLGIGFVFKSSFDKANRTTADSARGVGLDQAIDIFLAVREKCDVPITTDVHEANQCAIIAHAVDMLQIPAFLCRQTDLLKAAGATGLAVNIKKGQFMSPQDMQHAVAKLKLDRRDSDIPVLLTERGTSFGYQDLIVDMRSIPTMAEIGCPIIFDATHAIQKSDINYRSAKSHTFAPLLARAALAVGISGLFIETHESPETAPSDGDNMIILSDIEEHLRHWQRIDQVCKDF